METALDPRLSGLFEWLTRHGSTFPGCAPQVIPGMGTGLVASQDLAVGDRILHIPRELWFTRKTRHTRFTAVADHAHAEGLLSHSMCRPALLLLLERAIPDSFFAPYLDALGEPTMPFGGPGETEADLQSERMVRWVRDQAETTAGDIERLRAVLPSAFPDMVDEAWLTLEAWRWAYGHVVQRSFSVDHEGDEVWVLVPGMDLCNHESGVPTGYSAPEDGWLLEAPKAVPAGAQVTISYGKAKTSADLFLWYGFVPPDNPNDRILVRLRPEPDDPNGEAKQFVCDELGLSTEARIGIDGSLPAALRNAAVLFTLDEHTFGQDGNSFTDPRFEAAALEQIAAGIAERLAALPTTRAYDEAQLAGAAPGDPMVPAYGIRIAFKRIMEGAVAGLRRHVQSLKAGAVVPNQPTPEFEEGRDALIEVTVPLRPAAPR